MLHCESVCVEEARLTSMASGYGRGPLVFLRGDPFRGPGSCQYIRFLLHCVSRKQLVARPLKPSSLCMWEVLALFTHNVRGVESVRLISAARLTCQEVCGSCACGGHWRGDFHRASRGTRMSPRRTHRTKPLFIYPRLKLGSGPNSA